MKKKILIVEDSDNVQARLKSRINSLFNSYITDHAMDTTTALSSLIAKPPDVVILDIQLPDGSGIDILAKIKKDSNHIIVIILTNFPYSIIRARCMELGADYFFDKSKDFNEVMDVLREIK